VTVSPTPRRRRPRPGEPENAGSSPLLLLGALGQRLHVELGQVPAVLVPPEVPLWKQRSASRDARVGTDARFPGGGSAVPYLSEPHAVPLVGRLLRLGRVHQLEARLVLLVEVGVLAAAPELRRVLI